MKTAQSQTPNDWDTRLSSFESQMESIPTTIQTQINESLPTGILSSIHEAMQQFLVVELDYIPNSDVCFSHSWTPFPNGGVWGISPHNCHQGVQGGAGENFCSPPGGDSGEAPLKQNIGKIFLVKYCNFIVNMDHSL
jgi:hypothetical protein